MKEIGRNLNKLVREVKMAQSPEAMVYLRLLGNELGYLRTTEITEMTYSAAMMIDSMLKMFPTDVNKTSYFHLKYLTDLIIYHCLSFDLHLCFYGPFAKDHEGPDDQG